MSSTIFGTTHVVPKSTKTGTSMVPAERYWERDQESSRSVLPTKSEPLGLSARRPLGSQLNTHAWERPVPTVRHSPGPTRVGCRWRPVHSHSAHDIQTPNQYRANTRTARATTNAHIRPSEPSGSQARQSVMSQDGAKTVDIGAASAETAAPNNSEKSEW